MKILMKDPLARLGYIGGDIAELSTEPGWDPWYYFVVVGLPSARARGQVIVHGLRRQSPESQGEGACTSQQQIVLPVYCWADVAGNP